MPTLQPITPPPAPAPLEFHLKPTRQPMLWAALAYSFGIIAGTHLWHPPLVWIAAAAGFLAAGLYFLRRRNWLAAALALGTFFFAGALHIQMTASTNVPDTTLQPFADGQQVEIIAHVTREGKFREGSPNETRQIVDVRTEEILTDDGKKIPSDSGIRLGIYSTLRAGSQLPGETRRFHYGERIRLPVKLKLPRNFHNPGAFDYEGYLASNGIAALGSTKFKMSNHYPDSPETVSNSGELAFTPASSPRCTCSGPRLKPRCSTPCSSAKKPSSIATRVSISSAPAPTTSLLSQE